MPFHGRGHQSSPPVWYIADGFQNPVMKKCISLLTAFAAVGSLFAQSNPNDDPDWSLLMTDPNVNVHEVIELFNQRWEGREVAPGSGYKPFKRWEHLMHTRVDEAGNVPPASVIVREFLHAQELKSLRSENGNWQNLGPILDGQTSRVHIPGVGRTNHVAFHPTDPNVVFCGTPAGGLWRSYDGGNNWISTTDDLPTLGVSAIAFDPFDPNTVYIGTGDRDAGDAPGMGVMKSTDGGISWVFVNSGMEDLTIGDIVCDPENPGVVLAASRFGVRRSTDYGATWEVTSNSMYYKQILFKPGNSQIVYATAQGRFFRSENNGQSFTQITNGMLSATRSVIAVTEADPERVYVCAANTYDFRGFFQSTDGGISFTEMSDSPNILGWSASGDQPGGQAWFDLCMEADPINPDRVFVGGIRMKRSDDGGATWIDIQNSFLHVDHHWMKFSPHDGNLYLCNDGGIYRYPNQAEWVDISHGIISGQIYKFGQAPLTANKALSGYQDNGTMEFNGVGWRRSGGADGFECQYDPIDEAISYNSIYYGQVYRTNSQVSNERICGLDELGITEEGAWSAPWFVSRFNSNAMYAGLKNVWRSKNIKHPIRDSIVWERISFSLGGSNNVNLNGLVQSRSDSNVLYMSKGSRRFFRTTNANAPVDEVQWSDLSNLLPWVQQPVSAIETHPTDSSTVYIGFDSRVWKSIDYGDTWVNISGTLPFVSMNSLVIDVTGNEALYVGTDNGVYFKDASMDDWVSYSNNLPLGVRVTELEIYYGQTSAEHRLRASTYGRGMWESDLHGSDVNFFPATAWLNTADGAAEVYGPTTVNLGFYRQLNNVSVTAIESSNIYIENATITNFTADGATFSFEITPNELGVIKLVAPLALALDDNGLETYASDTLNLIFLTAPEPFGIDGPGGVGDTQDITLWLRGDAETFTQAGGNAINSDGAQIGEWRDALGNNRAASQLNPADRPILRTEENGINGMPAVEFNGVNTALIATEIPSSVDFSVLSVAKSANSAWNEHGWIASARGDNGFIIHPWKNSSLLNVTAISNQGQYYSSPQEWIVDAADVQLYGLIYNYHPQAQLLQKVINGTLNKYPSNDHVERVDGALLNVNYGWDFEDRFGEGLIAEHVIFNRRIYDSQRIIISNYLGAKYGFNIDPNLRYARYDMKHEVAGIGQVAYYDAHTDAKGSGIVRMLNADDLEDEEFLLWGHNNAPLEWVNESYPLLSPHIQRHWAFEQTGNVGSVEVRIYAPELADFGGEIGIVATSANSFLPDADVAFYPLTQQGEYLVANVNFEGSGTFTIGSQPVVGIENLSRAAIRVYPNPAGDFIRIQLNGADAIGAQLAVFDAAGREVMRNVMTQQEEVLNLTQLAQGIYTVVIEKDQQRQVARFVHH